MNFYADNATVSTDTRDSSSEDWNSLLAHQTISINSGNERIRCSAMLKDNVLASYADENVRTLHDVFLHGLKASGKDFVETVRNMNKTFWTVASYADENVRTLHDVFLHELHASDGGPCLGWRPKASLPYIWISYSKVLDRCQRFGSGLASEGISFNQSQMIGLYAQNCVEWKIVEQTCSSFSMVLVPIYPTSTSDVINYIINKCELRTMVVDTVANATILLNKCIALEISLTLIIVIEELDNQILRLAASSGITVRWFLEIEEFGRLSLKEFVVPKPHYLQAIAFTCGTTGLPKGVMLTHGNIVAAHAGVTLMGCETFLKLDKSDVYISYLSSSHMFERVLSTAIYFVGGRIGFFQGNIRRLLDDISTLRPTVLPVIPRIINGLHDKMEVLISKFPHDRLLIKMALNAKRGQLRRGHVTYDTFWDKFVLRKFHELMGGRLRFCIAGAAHVSLKMVDYVRVSLGVTFTEVYGMTETACAMLLNIPGHYGNSSLGSPILCNFVKLVDIPQKNISAKQGVGEICVKGGNVFHGYYKDEKLTKEVFDERGWLHTGDVGLWLPNGALEVIDRIDYIIKLCEGVYIAPEKIEGILVQSSAVSQVFVYGDNVTSLIVAIVHTESRKLENWCKGKGIDGTISQHLENERVNELILKDLWIVGKKSGLLPFELPKHIYLTPVAFSAENNLLTPTLLKKRFNIYEKYEKEIKSLLDKS